MSDKIINVTDATFEAEVLNSTIPVLVDFWAPWCGPCKAMAPTLDLVAEELDGKLKIVKVDVDENFETAAKYKVRGVPTFTIFEHGVAKLSKSGSMAKAQLLSFIAS
jgi:thioredoxin 1